VDVVDALARWDQDGFVVCPKLLPIAELAPGCAELGLLFPTADEFHDDADPSRNARFRDEFDGITNFPFVSAALSRLSVHPSLIELATALLGTDDLRVYSIEAWAKYTGAADYDQPHHRDYLAHTLLVPTHDPRFREVEMFLYLTDVPRTLGPPSFVPRRITCDIPALPNWYPRQDADVDPDHPTWGSPTGRPDLYDEEVSAEGPAGTVVAYALDTFHRGTQLTEPRGARYTLHVTFRAGTSDWTSRRAWTDKANTVEWHAFVTSASIRQLELFGFPARGHPYWTSETLAGMALRYPGLDPSSWET
jgi:hypothetical protein